MINIFWPLKCTQRIEIVVSVAHRQLTCGRDQCQQPRWTETLLAAHGSESDSQDIDLCSLSLYVCFHSLSPSIHMSVFHSLNPSVYMSVSHSLSAQAIVLLFA